VSEEKDEPLVSVIMNCLNCDKFLEESIESVFEQSYDNWEIIFWDNASVDNSAQIAKSYDGRLRYFRGDHTTSLGEARNNALEHVNGKYIAFLDTDDVWLPNKLDLQVQLMESNRDIGLSYSDSVFFNDDGDQYNYFSKVVPHRGSVTESLLIQGFVSTETMMVRKESLDAIDFRFDDSFTMVMDYDLTIRLSLFYMFDYIEQPLSKWRMHVNSTSSMLKFSAYHEIEKMLDKLESDFPGFIEDNKMGVDVRRKKNNYFFALENWSNKNKLSAVLCAFRSNGFFNRVVFPFVVLIMSFHLYQSVVDFVRKYRSKLG